MKANYKKKSFPHSDEIVGDRKNFPERGKIRGVENWMSVLFFAINVHIREEYVHEN
jgi:hypothetical protein